MQKKTKILILSIIIIILVLIGATFVYWLKTAHDIQKEGIRKEDIRKKVLSHLEENLEFCEISKDNISPPNGEFWLMCNGRPFYTEYKEGNLVYDLNGWGWLKKTDYWDELKDCEYYDNRNSELLFYCPFTLENPIVKIYHFEDFKLSKIKEQNFLEILEGDLKQMYKFLNECELSNSKLQASRVQRILSLTFKCQDGDYNLSGDLTFFSLPILDSSDENVRTKVSFQKVFGITPEIKDNAAQAQLNSLKFTVKYPNILESVIEIAGTNFEDILKTFGKYLIFPSKEIREAQLVKEIEKEPPLRELIFKTNEGLVNLILVKDKVMLIERKWEGYHE